MFSIVVNAGDSGDGSTASALLYVAVTPLVLLLTLVAWH